MNNAKPTTWNWAELKRHKQNWTQNTDNIGHKTQIKNTQKTEKMRHTDPAKSRGELRCSRRVYFLVVTKSFSLSQSLIVCALDSWRGLILKYKMVYHSKQTWNALLISFIINNVILLLSSYETFTMQRT